MADASMYDSLRLPTEWLIALDWRDYHFQMQPYHYLIRMVHILSMSAFYGAIGLLDLRLLGIRGTVPLRAFAEHILAWLYGTFAIAVITGAALFLYDPLHIGARAYWTPKLIAITLGLLNAVIFHRGGYIMALASEHTMPRTAKIAGAVSLALWTMVIVFSCLNAEGVPKVMLR